VAVGMKMPVKAKLAEMLRDATGQSGNSAGGRENPGGLRYGRGPPRRRHLSSVAANPADMLQRLRHANLRDQFEARLGLEIEAVRLGALRHTAEDISHLHALLDARGNWKNEQDKPAFVVRDFAFHVAIVATAGNTPLVELYRFFSSAVNETIAATLGEDIPEPDMAAHRSLIDAIASGEPARSDETMRAFMSPIFLTLETLLNR
jgi:DNA-binding FadR family transcriptional regulator